MFHVRIEPGGHELRVAPGDNVLGAALAAGLPLPHSCRAGRCASCKAKLLAGEIAYPDGSLPPGIVPAEAARGEVLLCQAQPRTDLVVETRRAVAREPGRVSAEIGGIERVALEALRVRLRMVRGTIVARPGQFVDVRNGVEANARLPVVAARTGELDLEAPDDGSEFRQWLNRDAAPGSVLYLAGPFDFPR